MLPQIIRNLMAPFRPRLNAITPAEAAPTTHNVAMLEYAIMTQLERTLAALPSWDGARHAVVETFCVFGRTTIHFKFARVDELGAEPSQRMFAARKVVRELFDVYVRRVQPGQVAEVKGRRIGDVEMVCEIGWSLEDQG